MSFFVRTSDSPYSRGLKFGILPTLITDENKNEVFRELQVCLARHRHCCVYRMAAAGLHWAVGRPLSRGDPVCRPVCRCLAILPRDVHAGTGQAAPTSAGYSDRVLHWCMCPGRNRRRWRQRVSGTTR